MTKIIQISDPHIVPLGELAYGQVDTTIYLRKCVETINRILPEIGPVDMAFVAGDLTDFGTEEEYKRFRNIMVSLKIPYRAIPGNHDNVSEMRNSFSDQDWMPPSGPINWAVEFSDLAVIGLDTNVFNKSHGHLTANSLSYLKNLLKKFGTKPVIVAVHHLLENNPNPSDDEIRESLSGNICRCTGYGRILEAVRTVADQRRTNS